MPMRLFFFIFLLMCCQAQALMPPPDSLGDKRGHVVCANETPLCKNVVGVCNPQTNCNENYVYDPALYALGLDTLSQIRFWRRIMNLKEDSALVSLGHSRDVVQKIAMRDWNAKNDSLKRCYRDSVLLTKNLDSTTRVLVTGGKHFFYDFDKASLNFQKGINGFIDNGVDPWYAQAILLIESPNKLQKSSAGAYGSFQLMKDVARLYGLKVNAQMDERANLERSAYAASSLIKTICIPKACKILDSLHITSYNQNELWFKLLVMHIYHAGAYNVQCALFTFMPSEGNMKLIYNLWQAQTSRFKSASQNYSQLILAAMFEMNDRVALSKRADLTAN